MGVIAISGEEAAWHGTDDRSAACRARVGHKLLQVSQLGVLHRTTFTPKGPRPKAQTSQAKCSLTPRKRCPRQVHMDQLAAKSILKGAALSAHSYIHTRPSCQAPRAERPAAVGLLRLGPAGGEDGGPDLLGRVRGRRLGRLKKKRRKDVCLHLSSRQG